MLSQDNCVSHLLHFPSGIDDHSLSMDKKTAVSNTLFFWLLISDVYNWSMLLLLYLVWKQSSTLLFLKKNVCMCVFLRRRIGMCGCTCMCIHMYMCLSTCRGQDTTSGIILRNLIYLPMRQGLSLAYSSLFSLD